MAVPNTGLALPDDIGADEWPALRSAWRRLVSILRNIVARDKTGTVTFRASQTTTTLTDPRITATSQVVLTPTTANANTAWLTHYIAETALVEGSRVITHASAVATDQTFRYSIRGA